VGIATRKIKFKDKVGKPILYMSEPIQVFIVDDLRLLREGLVCLLAEQKDLSVIGAEASGSQAIAKIRELRPDVALIDIGLPDKGGISMTRTLHGEAPEVKIIILGMLDLTDEIIACIEAGAAGYVLKEAKFDYLIETIRAVCGGESFCSPRIAASLFSRIAGFTSEHLPNISQSSIKLTGRELEIIKEIAGGLSNKEIAQRLCIELQTVKNHIHNILDKLQLRTRLEVVQYAREKNLLNKQQ
jgi:DNA-binding NarL/FixJ family response regulator